MDEHDISLAMEKRLEERRTNELYGQDEENEYDEYEAAESRWELEDER